MLLAVLNINPLPTSHALLGGALLPPSPVSPILAGAPLPILPLWRSVIDCVRLFSGALFVPSPALLGDALLPPAFNTSPYLLALLIAQLPHSHLSVW